ncbi:FtsW/RodA/SpoVE family cell cycle protein [Phycisphaera mikurensis]|uniref:Probable peptidoglycan glycosyltransferase FtsW n=1 Tax=Phycisphaera mikurensis (strain NBRC 102666 / KCTC 22515 / FYK2301M01) TaxID=1142394 RepID=I0ICI4_PHYMF|nr:FtsW/RodA/SpoVE family cell cycle protein [Phycisphaera mikurensis]MBB6442152.1 cell division protein FtsW (lipid II flippase) [Phycisphaera mikurensis]BAM02972.1 cell cycle protein [Phycisphaera mikurensis NBRC 102666]
MLSRLVSLGRDLARPNAAWLGVAAAVALTWIGIAAIGTVRPDYAAKQARWLVIGLGGMAAFLLPPPRVLGRWSYAGFVLTIVLLVLLILPGMPRSLVPRINAATSWINLGFMNYQPAETAKVFFVLALAWYLRHRESHRFLTGLLPPFVLMLVPVGLIMKQPDLGSALLFGPTLLIVLVAAGARLRHLGGLVGAGTLVVAVVAGVTLFAPENAQILQPHQQVRIRALFAQAQGDDRYRLTSAFQQTKAVTLVGAGGISGHGRDRSGQMIAFNGLPFPYNDMIFPVVANRWGLAGSAGVVGLFLLMVGSFLAVAARARDPFARLACVGFAAMIFVQAALNVAMCLRLAPITGITLPFMSYGGSSLLSSFTMLGLVLNFAARRERGFTRKSFEFE